MKATRRDVWLASIAVFGLALPVAHGQSLTGSVWGAVFEPSGARVVADVTASRTETGRESVSAGMPDGSYRFLALEPGDYEIRPRARGFVAPAVRVRVRVGTSVRLDLAMHLETERFDIQVQDATPQLEAETAAIGSVVNRREMRDLPLNQRLFLPLTLLAGGTHASAPGSELSTQHDSGFHVAGGREASNNFLLDGIDNNDLYINRLVVGPPLDTIREFRLHSTGYRAEFGRSAGGQFNVVSRSGTKQLHGSAYEYLRNEALDARNYFDPAQQRVPVYRRNQFGGTLGGPVGPQDTYFFAGAEATRIRDASTRTASVPSPDQSRGDFSAMPTAVIDPSAGAPFPDNTVPVTRQSAAGRAVAEYWPTPNRDESVQNYVATPLGDSLINQAMGRLDKALGQAGRAFVRYNLGHNRSFAPFSESDVPGFGSFTVDRGHHLATSYTHALSPLILIEARAGFNILHREVQHENAGHDIASELGISGLSRDPRLVGFPGINVAGFASLSDDTALPIARTSSTMHIAASATRAGARHRLKWGGEHRDVRIDGFQGLFGRGQFNFLGAISGNSVADLLLGVPTFSIQTAIDNDFRQRAGFWNGYLQDDWGPRRGLTVSLGVRYEFNAPTFDADDRFSQFDLETARLVEPGSTVLGRAGYAPDGNNLAPRVGIAWNPSESLVLRTAYGVYYEANVLEANSGLYFNPPYFKLGLFLPSPSAMPRLEDAFSGAGLTPPASVNAIQPNFRTGYGQHWNAGLERALPGRIVARATYIGSKGSKLLRRRNLNQPAPGAGEVDARRPVGGFANIALFESGASSTYHSGVLTLERRFHAGTGFRFAYTWAKSIDDASAFLGSAGDQSFPQNSHDFRAERGLSNFDQRHRLVATLQYAVPSHHWLTGGWRAFAIATFAGGRPATPQLAEDRSNTGNTGGIFGADRPHLVGAPRLDRRTPERFFDPAAFASPPAFSFGNAGRNVLRGPGMSSLDVALVRSVRLTGNATAEFRIEAFNLSNSRNFALPERTFGLPTFGRIFAAGQARQVQLGFRVTF